MTRKVRRDRAWLVVGAVVVAVTGCDTPAATEPAASPSSATTPALGPPPWTVAELTDHPCAVLGPDEIAGFVLDPHEIRPDGRNGGCGTHVSVPSGGSFHLGIVAPGIATGVDWDVCAKTVAVATAISARLR
ncbi:hypothetical protein [Nocardia sputi]|uniref:hypothetical protein n=1 Tax=Nocardia sputi TaxID=2943705 RepID=UPI0020C182A9|nr:hypothetical protein [Nocardia sputi]